MIIQKGRLQRRSLRAAFAVHNKLGSGFVEKVYENALAERTKDGGSYS